MDDTWKKQTLAKLQTLFRDHFLDDRLTITESTSPADIEDWDSLAHINLLASVEAEYGIRFSAEDMAEIDSVATLLRALERLTKA